MLFGLRDSLSAAMARHHLIPLGRSLGCRLLAAFLNLGADAKGQLLAVSNIVEEHGEH